MKVNLLIILSFLLFSSNTFAKFKCNSSLKSYAKELLQLELSGSRISSKGQCINQDKFKYIYAAHDPVGEAVQKVHYVKNNDFKILDIKAVKGKKKLYKVDFKIKSKNKDYKDSFVMWHRSDAKYGCGINFTFPSRLYVYSSCQ
jgi:hypothetical protein